MRIHLLTPSPTETRKFSIQGKLSTEFSRSTERHQTEPNLAYKIQSPTSQRDSWVKTSRMNTRDTNITVGMTSSPTDDTNRGKSLERSLPEIKITKAATKQPAKKKFAKKINLPKGEKEYYPIIHQPYLSDFLYLSHDLSSPYQLVPSRTNMSPSILVDTPRSIS